MATGDECGLRQIPATAAGGGIGAGLQQFREDVADGTAQPDNGLPVPRHAIAPLWRTVRDDISRLLGGRGR